MIRIAFAVVVGWLLMAAGALAETRVALVIGNSAYQSVTPLTNPENDATEQRSRAGCSQRRPSGLEQLPVGDARRTRGFACAAAEASVDVGLDAGVVEGQLSFDHRSHQNDATAWTVVLILEIHIRRTRLQTESAVHARFDSRNGRRQRRVGNGAGERPSPGQRGRRHAWASPRIPGLSR